ncbi:TonB-dependent receptor [Arcticibacter svalbardensis MN12-7]|uniref:TonB-dependent receptor n=2 Tax=Arcticibacter TaxID=1288026 RepID=R9GU08_9SPHI|nr:TonB-dependent receptor [Arcticibacter svalbardensis MN12-7]
MQEQLNEKNRSIMRLEENRAVTPTYIIIRWCTFLFFFQIFLANGQNIGEIEIIGRLRDSRGEPISFATVLVKGATSSQIIKSTQSNDKGMFRLELSSPQQLTLEIRMIGFEVYTKTDLFANVDQIDLGTIELKETSIMLKGVVIKSEKPFIENQAGKIVVNLENEILSNGLSVVDLMNQLPGVQITPDDQIKLNGRGITIFIDGKATPLSTEALQGMLRGMNSSNLQKIELITNPSSKYNAEGSGGIINLVKKKNHKEGLTGSVYGGYQYGKYGRPNAGVVLNFKNKLYNVFLSGDYSYTKYILDANINSSFFSADQQLQSESMSMIRSIRSNRSVSPSIGVDLYLSRNTTLSLSGNLGDQNFEKNGKPILFSYNLTKTLFLPI